MTPAELTKELDELESQLERLRIKYDQYFTGTERMLPFVLRKDVDRRFHALHRDPIRNTGLRFRFQTMLSRFTTYQTQWGRIIRQIEEGTFKRDVARAQRLGIKLNAGKNPRQNPSEPEELSADQLEEIDEPGSTHAARGSNREELPESLFGAWRPDPSHGREELPMGSDFDPPEVPVHPVPVAPMPAADARPEPEAEPAARPRPGLSPFGNLRVPGAAARPARTETAPSPVAPAAVASPAGDGPPAPGRVVQPPPGVVIPPRVDTGAQPVAGVGGVRGMPLRQPLRGTTGAHPAPAPAPVPSPVKPPAEPARPQPAARPTGDDAGIRQLYDRYLEARKQTGESVNVQFETVARQVRETLPRLSEKYQGADVKLDVTIKDGKAILRPVVTVKKK